MNAPAQTKLARGVDYELRDGTPDDWAFVLDSWRWSQLATPHWAGCPRDLFFAEITPRILAALERGRLRIAHDLVDPGTLLGFAAFEQLKTGLALHYVLVRRDFRGQRIARELLVGEPVRSYTHKPRNFRGAPAGWTFNPWAFVPVVKGL